MAEAIQYPTILPKVAALELTYRCNHKCLFCSCPWEADEKYLKEELSYQEWTRIIDTLISIYIHQQFGIWDYSRRLPKYDLYEVILLLPL